MKKPVGAVVVKNNRIISMGYNGTPTKTKNCYDGGCDRCNNLARAGTELEACLCVHGEMNAILMAGRLRCRDCTIYTTLYPCLMCSKAIV